MKKAILLLLLLTAGCANSPPSAEQDVLKERAFYSKHKYLECMDAAAGVFSVAEITPTEAGVAAQGQCSLAFTVFESAVHRYVVDPVREASLKMHASEAAARNVLDIKKMAQETVVAKVVRLRMLRSDPPAATKAPRVDGM